MNRLGFFVSILLCLMAFTSNAQDSAVQQRYKIAVFTPFFLDSAFDEYSNYRYGKNFPKFINPGLEFYEGSIMAADSLNNEGVPLEVSFYDSRDDSSSIQNAVANAAFDSVDLVIGHVNGSEARMLAMFAAQKSIPFINTTYPNDAGISNNPYYVILNSTLYTHCSAMYKFIQKNHALKNVVLFRKKGAQEDRLEEYFKTITNNTSAVPLKIKVVTLEDSFTPEDVKEHLNSDASTICIAGSLDLPWGQLLAQTLAALYTETPTILFGMPTWWDNTDFSKPEYKGLEVMYTTPFYYYHTNPLVVKIGSEFRTRFYSRPTDMVYRGYETLYHFAHLLQIHGNNISSALADKKFRILTDLDIQPVLNPKTNTLDYFENKKIYLVRKLDGVVTAVY